MEYAIEIEDISKSYGRFQVLDHLSLRVPRGKVYGFLGKNGAGKTTTIRSIMGLIRPQQGRIRVLGKDSGRERRWAARVLGAIVETPGFYDNLTARGNLALTAELYGTDRRRIDEVLEIVGLQQVRDKKARHFSLGMKQRLGIANVLIPAPQVLILDEPTNGLDPSGIKEMREFIRTLCDSQGITVLVSSHILSEVQQMADVVGIIDHGHLITEVDIRDLQEEGQQCLLLDTPEKEQAFRVLKEMQLSFQNEGEQIRIFCGRELNGQVNRRLVLEGIEVLGLSPVQPSLEEKFLALTSGIQVS